MRRDTSVQLGRYARSHGSLAVPALIFLAGFDPRLENVLLRRQRAGCKLGKGAGGIVGLIEIQRETRVVLRLLGDVEEAGRSVSRVAGCGVAEDEEQAAVLCDRIEAVGLAVELEFG